MVGHFCSFFVFFFSNERQWIEIEGCSDQTKYFNIYIIKLIPFSYSRIVCTIICIFSRTSIRAFENIIWKLNLCILLILFDLSEASHFCDILSCSKWIMLFPISHSIQILYSAHSLYNDFMTFFNQNLTINSDVIIRTNRSWVTTLIVW